MEEIQDTARPFKCDKCDKCDKTYKWNCHRLEHGRKIHNQNQKVLKKKPKKQNSKAFNKSVITVTGLVKKHEQTRPFKCDKCDKTFKRKNNYKEHVQIVHDQLKRFHCDICDFSTFYKARLNVHVENQVHYKKDETQKWSCVHCDKSYKYKSHLEMHLVEHVNIKHAEQKCQVVKSYKCDHCDKSFHDTFDLEDHLKLMQCTYSEIKCLDYTEFQDLMCAQCEETFRLKKQLVIHIESVHEIKNAEYLMKDDKNTKCEFFCDYCDKGYSTKGNLEVHIKAKHPVTN
jgi:KRAB domain-containing zinc finger protein